ncbi:hypothetical protein BaRGS_00019444 [Batillaria attramentaria]|uniref:C-type lectin domain-containing protein n=1 Tax=Batillaria attramentaria TaxID=370345 RepID=A0ABD0KQV9_9CAEN
MEDVCMIHIADLATVAYVDWRFGVHIGAARPLEMWGATYWPGGIPNFFWVTGEWVDTTADRQYWEPDDPNNANGGGNILAWSLQTSGDYLLVDRLDNQNDYRYICEKP